MMWRSALWLALTCAATTVALPAENHGQSCPVKHDPLPNWHEGPFKEVIRLIEGCPEGRGFCRELIHGSEVTTKTKTVTPMPTTVKIIQTITDHSREVTRTTTKGITSIITEPRATATHYVTSTLTQTVPLTTTDLSTSTSVDVSTVFLTSPDFITITKPATSFMTNTVTEVITDDTTATVSEYFTDTTTETFSNTITDYATVFVTSYITDHATNYVTNLHTEIATDTITNSHTETTTISFTDTATATVTDTISSTTTREVDVTTTDTQSLTTIQTDFITSTNTLSATETDYITATITSVETDGVTVTATAVTTIAPVKRAEINARAALHTPSALKNIHDGHLSSACSFLWDEKWLSTTYTTTTVAKPTVGSISLESRRSYANLLNRLLKPLPHTHTCLEPIQSTSQR